MKDNVKTAESATWTLGLAWLIALSATLGALFIGEVLGQTPCILCWYQRIAMFPLVLILGAGFLFNDDRAAFYGKLIVWPGLAMAFWHVGLYFGFIPEAIKPCSEGPSCTDANMMILGMPIPLQSLAAFAAILALLHATNRNRP